MAPGIILLFVLVAVDKAGSASRPVLSFRYSVVFEGAKVTMRCDTVPKEKDFVWLHDNIQVYQGEDYVIKQAESTHTGDYQCQTQDGRRSDNVKLTVTEATDNPLILQAPPYIHEGDRLFLNCHTHPSNSALKGSQNKFYKGNTEIRSWNAAQLYMKPDILVNASGQYRCEVSLDSKTILHKASASVQVRELYTTPKLQVTGNMAKNLTCLSDVSPYKPLTKLEYGFYKDGNNVQKYSPNNQYVVQKHQPKKGEKFYCAVRADTSSITKKSKEITVSKAAFLHNIFGLALSESILIISFIYIFIT